MSDTTLIQVYNGSYAEEARGLARLGATLSDLAEHFGVPLAQVTLWSVCHSDFAAALQMGKAEADDRVERALYSRAVGYTFDGEKVQYVNGGEDREGRWERTATREHLPPDPSACTTWLRNRRPDLWNEKHRHDVSVNGAVKHVLDLAALDRAELDELQRQYSDTLDLVAEVQSISPPSGD